jgi:hypothetical protein
VAPGFVGSGQGLFFCDSNILLAVEACQALLLNFFRNFLEMPEKVETPTEKFFKIGFLLDDGF